MKQFFVKHWSYIVLGVVLLLLFLSIAFLFNSNHSLRRQEKTAKIEIKALHKYNEDLIKELKLSRDSTEIYHDLAVVQNNKDTVYINQIRYLKNQTNAQITHFNSLSLDSQYLIFSSLIEEYSRTGFSNNNH